VAKYTKPLLGFSLMAMLASQSFAFDLKDVGRVFDKSYKCKKNDQGCKNREHLLAVAKVAAVAVAVKYIADMVIEHHASKVADEEGVVADYKKQNEALPEKPVASVYKTSTLPGSVVQPGKKVLIQSDIVVVPGRNEPQTLIQEKLAIYDNEDNTKELKSLTKDVNEGTKRAGHYTNEFSFTLPEGLPQGVYPIRTTLLLNGEETQTSNADIQLVLQVNDRGQMQIVAAR
jgi:hypothetical protein